MEVQHRIVHGHLIDRLGMDANVADADQGLQGSDGTDTIEIEQDFDLEVGGYFPAEG